MSIRLIDVADPDTQSFMTYAARSGLNYRWSTRQARTKKGQLIFRASIWGKPRTVMLAIVKFAD